MKVKEENENIGLKLNIQKTKIMASSPITSWQIDGETVETVADYFFAGGLRPLVELCVEPAGLCGRCTGVAVPLRVVPSPTGLPSKRCPGPSLLRQCSDSHHSSLERYY